MCGRWWALTMPTSLVAAVAQSADHRARSKSCEGSQQRQRGDLRLARPSPPRSATLRRYSRKRMSLRACRGSFGRRETVSFQSLDEAQAAGGAFLDDPRVLCKPSSAEPGRRWATSERRLANRFTADCERQGRRHYRCCPNLLEGTGPWVAGMVTVVGPPARERVN